MNYHVTIQMIWFNLSQPRPQASMILKPDVSQKKRILVVDDEVDITTVFKLGLEKANLVVDAYNDPMLALSEYKPGSVQKTS